MSESTICMYAYKHSHQICIEFSIQHYNINQNKINKQTNKQNINIILINLLNHDVQYV
jgi:hypothetical protein